MDKTVDFVTRYYKYAKKSEFETRIPALFTLSQAALETGWGKKSEGNNLFGIMADKNWKGDKILIHTWEFHDTDKVKYPEIESITYLKDKKKYKYVVKRYARKYDDVSDCFNDHNEFLKKTRYKKAFDYTDDPKKFANEVAKGGYATSLNYAKTLHSLIDRIGKIVLDENLDKSMKGTVNTRRLNVRVAPDADADKVDVLKKGEKVELLEKEGDWIKIKESIGWVASEFIDQDNEVIPRRLNVRDEPDGDKLAKIKRGDKVKPLEDKGEWVKIVFESWWVYGKYINFGG